MDAHFLDFCFLSLSHKGLNSLEQGKHWPPRGGRIDPPASGGLRPSGHHFAGAVVGDGEGLSRAPKGWHRGEGLAFPTSEPTQAPDVHRKGCPLDPRASPSTQGLTQQPADQEEGTRTPGGLGLRHMACGHLVMGLFHALFSIGLRRQSSGAASPEWGMSTAARQSAGGQLTDPQGRPQACPVGG
jgi:hypothetical protein